MTTTQTAHPFELSRLGIGPFALIGVISTPSPSLAEANPSAYMLALQEMSESARGYGVQTGICEHCGMCLMHNGVIQDSKGKRFVVGLDCARKTDDDSLGQPAAIAQAQIRKEVAR